MATKLGNQCRARKYGLESLFEQTKRNGLSNSRAGWIGDYEDPNTFLDIMRTGRGNNRTGWSNQEFDELVGKANATTDQEERYRLLGEAEKILIDELPIIPIYTYVRSYQLSPDVKGYYQII